MSARYSESNYFMIIPWSPYLKWSFTHGIISLDPAVSSYTENPSFNMISIKARVFLTTALIFIYS